MDKTSIVVISICAVLLFFTWPTPSPVAPQAPATAIQTDSQPAPALKQVTASVITAVKKTTNFKLVELTNEALTLTLDPNEAGITSVKLNSYFGEEDKEQPYHFSMLNAPLLKLQSKTGYQLQVTESKQEGDLFVVSGKIDGIAVEFTQTFTLSKGETEASKYIIDSTVSFINKGTTPIVIGDLFVGIGSVTPLIPDSSSYIYGGETNQRVSWRESKSQDLTGENVKTVDEEDKNTFTQGATSDWVSLENRYFASIVSSKSKFIGLSATTVPLKGQDGKGLRAIGEVSVPMLNAGQSQEFSFSAYVGPKKYDYLIDLGEDQEDLLDLGWSFIRPLSKLVLRMLIWLSSVGINIGLAIIIITVIIKGIFWPITHKSSVSMKKMSSIQPMIKEIREKHKGDQQMIQQKTMEIYKENKVNPIGGCLPMFIQIPVFFALYSTFRSAVELRQSSFLWCNDLARPDTVAELFSVAVNPLALAMVVTMFAQQLLAPTSADPNQKKMMLAMPFVMLFFMYDMPAGLTLYWTVSQLLSIVQQYFTNKSLKKDAK